MNRHVFIWLWQFSMLFIEQKLSRAVNIRCVCVCECGHALIFIECIWFSSDSESHTKAHTHTLYELKNIFKSIVMCFHENFSGVCVFFFSSYCSVSFSFFHFLVVYFRLSFMWEIWCTAFIKPHFISFHFTFQIDFLFPFLIFPLVLAHSFSHAVSFYLEFDALSEIWQWNLNPIIENLVHWMSDCVYRLFNGNFFIVWHEKPTIWTWVTVWPSNSVDTIVSVLSY